MKKPARNSEEDSPLLDYPTSASTASVSKFGKPLTIIFSLICIGLFAAINLMPLDTASPAWIAFGGLAPELFHAGQHWRLLSAAFVHIAVWHVFFNVYMFWYFGNTLEHRESTVFVLWLVLSGAIVGNAFQLLLSDMGVYGLSGVCYALFGFVLLMERFTERYKGLLSNTTRWVLLGFLVASFVLNNQDILNLSTAVNVGGLLWGAFLALLTRLPQEPLRYLVSAVMGAFIVAAIWWIP